MSNISRPTEIHQNQFQQNPYSADPQFVANKPTTLQDGLQPGPLPHTGVQNPNTVPGSSDHIPHSNMSRDAIPQATHVNAAGEPVRDRTMGEKFDSATHTMHHKLAKDGGGNVELLKKQNEEKRELDKAHHRALHGKGIKEAGGIGDVVGQIGDKFSEGGQKLKHKIDETRTKMGNKEVVCDQHGNAMPVDKMDNKKILHNDTTFAGDRPLDSTGRPLDTMGRPLDAMNQPLDSMGRPIDSMGRPLPTGTGIMPTLEKQQGFQGGDPHLLEKQRMGGQFGGAAPLDVNRARG